jgi:hypothetical protein
VGPQDGERAEIRSEINAKQGQARSPRDLLGRERADAEAAFDRFLAKYRAKYQAKYQVREGCRVGRSNLTEQAAARREPAATPISQGRRRRAAGAHPPLVDARPSYGYRRITALLNRQGDAEGLARVNQHGLIAFA